MNEKGFIEAYLIKYANYAYFTLYNMVDGFMMMNYFIQKFRDISTAVSSCDKDKVISRLKYIRYKLD